MTTFYNEDKQSTSCPRAAAPPGYWDIIKLQTADHDVVKLRRSAAMSKHYDLGRKSPTSSMTVHYFVVC